MMMYPNVPRILTPRDIAAMAAHITKRPPAGDQSGLWD